MSTQLIEHMLKQARRRDKRALVLNYETYQSQKWQSTNLDYRIDSDIYNGK